LRGSYLVQDSAVLEDLDVFQSAHGASATVVGVGGEELRLIYHLLDAVIRVEMPDQGGELGEDWLAVGD
jgi:hypothetical protein